MRNAIGLLLLVVAYGLLWPGLTQPVLSITGTVDKAGAAAIGKDIIVDNPQTPEVIGNIAEYLLESMDISGDVEAYHRTRSILEAIRELQDNGFPLVAFLVALFSIVIPVVKGLMLLLGHLPTPPALAAKLRRAADLVSRWSMADVFVVGVFVAFLAANAIREEEGLLSFEAELGTGFYCFLGYCLLSILSGQVLSSASSRSSQR